MTELSSIAVHSAACTSSHVSPVPQCTPSYDDGSLSQTPTMNISITDHVQNCLGKRQLRKQFFFLIWMSPHLLSIFPCR